MWRVKDFVLFWLFNATKGPGNCVRIYPMIQFINDGRDRATMQNEADNHHFQL